MHLTDGTHAVRFLLVEDDADHADLIRRSFNQNNVANTIDHVSDGEAAMAFLRQESPYESAQRPDVILLDLRLPKLDGHEVLRRIKADEHLRTIPVVVLTTSQAEIDRAHAYSSHANSYLVKPVDFDQFHKLVVDLQMYWAVWNQPPAISA
jgi:CheY-like chemotaxis protein